MKNINGERLPTVNAYYIAGFFKGYRFLSNFYPCSVKIEGIVYPSSEHAYMAMKTLKQYKREEIAKIKNPGEAKKYGRALELRPFWDDISPAIMFMVLMCKFKQNPDLAQKLLETGDKYLIEANDWGDKKWGAVYNGVLDDFEGNNLLGKLLITVRESLKQNNKQNCV